MVFQPPKIFPPGSLDSSPGSGDFPKKIDPNPGGKQSNLQYVYPDRGRPLRYVSTRFSFAIALGPGFAMLFANHHRVG